MAGKGLTQPLQDRNDALCAELQAASEKVAQLKKSIDACNKISRDLAERNTELAKRKQSAIDDHRLDAKADAEAIAGATSDTPHLVHCQQLREHLPAQQGRRR